MNSVQIIMAVLVVVVVAVLPNTATNEIPSETANEESEELLSQERCDAIEDEGEEIIKTCYCDDVGIENSTEEIVRCIRCLWKNLREIEDVKPMVQECEIKYPEDAVGPLCQLKVIVCTCKVMDTKCPLLKTQVASKRATGNGAELTTGTAGSNEAETTTPAAAIVA